MTTADGVAVPVRWMGRQTVSTRLATAPHPADPDHGGRAWARPCPTRDLLRSPHHAFLIDGLLVQAGALVNGTTIIRETDLPERFTYWHVDAWA